MKVPDAPLCRRVGEAADAAFLQRDPLDLQKAPAAVSFQVKIKAGIPEHRLPADHLCPPDARQAEGSAFQSLLCHPVGGLGVHVYEPAPLLDRHQGVGRFPLPGNRRFQPDLRAGEQQLRAPAGVLHMDPHVLPLTAANGDEAVGPGQKRRRNGFPILQDKPSFCLPS